MSHQRYPSIDAVKEPHSVSLKVLRLSRPSLVAQYPILPPPSSSPDDPLSHQPPIPASLAYSHHDGADGVIPPTNPAPFVLTPMLNLPPSFGSAYVGETFSCTLCANYDIPEDGAGAGAGPKKSIRDVRIEAEMKTPSSSSAAAGGGGSGVVPAIKLPLYPAPTAASQAAGGGGGGGGGGGTGGVDLPSPGTSLQKILSFDLKEEGNHVLAVTVSYYEASELSGRTRTFRKLYQFMCKASLIVRTKATPLPAVGLGEEEEEGEDGDDKEKEEKDEEKEKGEEGNGRRRQKLKRRWVLEAQLENCSEEGILLESVGLELESGLRYEDCNDWQGGADGGAMGSRVKPVLQPGETEQVCFVIEEEGDAVVQEIEGRVVFGILQIGWRSEMGNRGFLSTGKLGTRFVKPK
ncbi:hypothetical protein VTH82DRAFT_8218 [Thermothelomyces myriococcoides]